MNLSDKMCQKGMIICQTKNTMFEKNATFTVFEEVNFNFSIQLDYGSSPLISGCLWEQNRTLVSYASRKVTKFIYTLC